MNIRLIIGFLLGLILNSATAFSACKTPSVVSAEVSQISAVRGQKVIQHRDTRGFRGKLKRQDRLRRMVQKVADWRIYPRGWFFICLGIAAVLAVGAFALVEFAIASTVLAVAAILAAVVALYFLALWIGYYWNY